MRRRSFDVLSRGGQTRRLRQLADLALERFPVRPARVTRLAQGWNATFGVLDSGGARYALRIHRPGGPTAAMVGAELTWLAALRRDTELSVPEPVTTRGGDLIAVLEVPGVPEPRPCDLLRWVDGRFVDDRLTAAHLRRVGAFAARLQEHGATMATLERPRVTDVTSLAAGLADNLGPQLAEHAAGLVTHADPTWDGGVVRAVIERARAARDALGPADFGLQHADLHQENYLFRRDHLGAIDFDDCGPGPYVYDLAVTLSELRGRPKYEALRDSLLAGYREVRPLPAAHEPHIDAFVAFRFLQLMLYMVEHRTEPMFRDDGHEDVAGLLGLLGRLARGSG